MRPLSEIAVSVLLLFTIFTNTFPAGLNLHLESEAGVQSGVPDTHHDTLLGTYPLCALLLEPSWSKSVGNNRTCSVTAPLNALKYIGGSGELSFGPEMLIEMPLSSSTIEITGAATYNYMPSAYEQTIPDSYIEFLLTYDQQGAGTVPLGGTYTVSLLRDIRTPRIDVKNTLLFTAKKSFTTKWYLFFKLGCAWNLSTFKGAGYVQPLSAAGASYMVNSRNMVLAQLFGNYTFYETTQIPVYITAGKSGKIKDTLMNDLKIPDIPFASLYMDYDRELSQNRHLHFIYMFTLFGRGDPYSLFFSHHLSVMIEWSSR